MSVFDEGLVNAIYLFYNRNRDDVLGIQLSTKVPTISKFPKSSGISNSTHSSIDATQLEVTCVSKNACAHARSQTRAFFSSITIVLVLFLCRE